MAACTHTGLPATNKEILVPDIFQETLEDTCEHADRAMIWNISLEPSDPLFAITKKLLTRRSFTTRGKVRQTYREAGRCKIVPEAARRKHC